MGQAAVWRSEVRSGLSCGLQCPQYLRNHLLFPRYINRELNQKQRYDLIPGTGLRDKGIPSDLT